jgi:thiol:disulfide interchange protein DsbA
MKRADSQVKTLGVDSTPTIVVNGKYRVTGASAGGMDKVPAVVAYLVDLESKK